MTPETMDWLRRKVPEFSQLEENERAAIYDFSFLWSLFEGSVLNCQCNVPNIRRFAEQTESKIRLNDVDFAPFVSYLQNRYYLNGNPTEHYRHLHVERSGSPEEVVEMLSNENCTEKVKLIGCLVVVFRLRNNLFHGEKWKYQLQGQLDNFQRANNFLRNLMDCTE